MSSHAFSGFTTDEIERLDQASRLIRAGHDRRKVLKLVGMAGLSMASFAASDPARAFVPLFVRLVRVFGPVGLAAAIPAAIELYHSEEAPMRGTLLLEHEDPFGLVHKRPTYVDVPGGSPFTLNDDGFRARTIGNNIFRARSAIDMKHDLFEVINS